MKEIFEQTALGNLAVKNRLIRSATFEGGADHGVITPFLKEVHEGLARGGVGLIITGMMAVCEEGCLNPGMVRVDLAEFVPQYAGVAEAVHRHDCKVVIQINHCGVMSMAVPEWQNRLGPSDVEGRARGMTVEEIKSVPAAFGAAARKCREAGADGVQIHGAHGYLISQFLSPFYNRREDEYGGAIENRARLLFEVYDEVRAQVGADYPVLVKINSTDLVENGMTGDECLWVCKELEKRGVDAVEVSAGLGLNKKTSPSQVTANEGYYGENGLRLAGELITPVISVGGHRGPENIAAYLNAGKVAAVSLARPLIWEPDLPRKWQSGDQAKARCINCNKCFLAPRLQCQVAS